MLKTGLEGHQSSSDDKLCNDVGSAPSNMIRAIQFCRSGLGVSGGGLT